ncbi:unnamed protein product [Schistosoma margrebowiei]|uniref:Uncharacterized protein n=1 Tax=Schistosoma margrebowiei TaxID=48269 RepID=A0A183MEZ1_9TREM|nr:unnamed protein product [Schistosoma margrebowiei]
MQCFQVFHNDLDSIDFMISIIQIDIIVGTNVYFIQSVYFVLLSLLFISCEMDCNTDINLDFVDDQVLLSHTHEQMKIKTDNVAAVSASIDLNKHKGKTKVLKFNTENSNSINLDSETLEDVKSFTYLESIIDEQRGSDAESSM